MHQSLWDAEGRVVGQTSHLLAFVGFVVANLEVPGEGAGCTAACVEV